MTWQAQNEEQWRMIDFILQGEPSKGLFWITCDQFQHRTQLINTFKERFPQYKHVIADSDGFEGGSLAGYFQQIFQKYGGNNGNPFNILHLKGIEQYISFQSDSHHSGFFQALNFERELFFNELPFILVFWTDSYCLVETHRESPDFWEWITQKFSFEFPPSSLVGLEEQGEFLTAEEFWIKPDQETQTRLHNRVARLLSQLNEASKINDQYSYWEGLGNTYFQLGDFEKAQAFYEKCYLTLIPNSEEKGEFAEKISLSMVNLIRVGGPNLNSTTIRDKIEQIKKLISEEEDLTAKITFLASLGKIALWLKTEEAISAFTQAIERIQQLNLPFSKIRPTIVTKFGEVCINFGMANYALEILTKSLEYYIKEFGENHPHVAEARSNLALVYVDLGMHLDAAKLLEKALAADIRNFGEMHPKVATRQSNLAVVYRNLGRHAEAAYLLENALASDMRNFGEVHPTVATRLSNLANVYGDLGRHGEAAKLLEQALSLDIRNFGENHPTIATRQSNLAVVYGDLGRHREAAELLEKAVAADIQNFGKNNPKVAIDWNNLAHLQIKMDKMEEAKLHIGLALSIAKEAWGENHPNTQRILNFYNQLHQS